MLFVAVLGIFCLATKAQDSMMGMSDVVFLQSEDCPDADRYQHTMKITKRKLNRTTDALDGEVNMDVTLDETMGIVLDINKEVDGGYKPYYLFEQKDDACNTIMKYCDENFVSLLELMGEPPQCPLKAGMHSVKGFIINYDKYRHNIMYGRFRTDAYFTSGEDKILCIRVYVEVKPKDALAV